MPQIGVLIVNVSNSNQFCLVRGNQAFDLFIRDEDDVSVADDFECLLWQICDFYLLVVVYFLRVSKDFHEYKRLHVGFDYLYAGFYVRFKVRLESTKSLSSFFYYKIDSKPATPRLFFCKKDKAFYDKYLYRLFA